MNRTTLVAAAISASFGLGFFFNSIFYTNSNVSSQNFNPTHMKLGAFSVSLSVQNLETSKAFYEKLGFTQFAGSMKSNYLIMKNEGTLIGLFQGMFEGNMLTFNPGWDKNAKEVEGYQDVRKIQQHLKSTGTEIINPADESTSGPASFLVKDPDGNLILFDQHL